MESRNSILKKALSDADISQQKLADVLGITRTAVNDRLNGEKEIDSVEFIQAVASLTGQNFYSFVGVTKEKDVIDIGISLDGKTLTPITRGDLAAAGIRVHTSTPKVEEPDLSKSIEYLKGAVIRPITVVVNPEGKELISYVPIKAQAGYQKGFADNHFMEKLPAFSLPALAKDATYRMFQVDGNSMMQLGGKGLKDGDIVIAQYVDDVISGMRDNRVYVVVSPDGVVIKRCINRLKLVDDPILILTSDNKSGEYPNIILRPKQIKEVWEAKKVISSDFSFDTNLFDVLGDLQAQTEILKERMNKLEKK